MAHQKKRQVQKYSDYETRFLKRTLSTLEKHLPTLINNLEFWELLRMGNAVLDKCCLFQLWQGNCLTMSSAEWSCTALIQTAPPVSRLPSKDGMVQSGYWRKVSEHAQKVSFFTSRSNYLGPLGSALQRKVTLQSRTPLQRNVSIKAWGNHAAPWNTPPHSIELKEESSICSHNKFQVHAKPSPFSCSGLELPAATICIVKGPTRQEM